MSWRSAARVALRICTVLVALLCSGHHALSGSCKEVEYTNANQIDYGPIKVGLLRGQAIDSAGVPVPQVCIGVFTETEHKLVTTVGVDENGRFQIPDLPSGRYRLVSQALGFCPANARIRVKRGFRKGKPLVVHMRPRGIDDCSYVARE